MGAMQGGIMATGAAALSGSLAAGSLAAGTMAATLGTVGSAMVGAFVGGMVGSAASQVVGKSMGVVEHFSLRQAVGSGLTAAATAGMGAMANSAGAPGWAKSAANYMKGNGALNYAARGAFSYMNSYAAQKITGQQASFSWGGVAASAAGSMVGNSLADGLSIGEPSVDGFIRSVSVGGSTGAANRMLNKGGKVDWVRIATDAFANEIGNSIVQSQFEVSYSGEAFNDRATAGTAAALDGSTRAKQDAFLNRRAANTDAALERNGEEVITVYGGRLEAMQGMADAAAQSLYMTRMTDRLTAARQGDAHQAKLYADLMNRKARMDTRREADAARAKAFWQSDAVLRGMDAAAGQGYAAGLDFQFNPDAAATFANMRAQAEANATGLKKALFPTIMELGERGVAGTLADDFRGAGKQLYNTIAPLAALSNPVSAIGMLVGYGPQPMAIADNELLGASIVEGATAIGGVVGLERMAVSRLGRVATNSGRQVSNLRTVSADAVNTEFVENGFKRPYLSSVNPREFATAADLDFVRVHGPTNQEGAWMVRAREIEGMNPAQIKEHLALKYAPTHVSPVTVLEGAPMRVGRVGPQAQWGSANPRGFQYELLDISKAVFHTARPFP